MKSRIAAPDVVRYSRTIDAPLGFVYRWCTDYREDDNKITGSKARRNILEKTKERWIYTTKERGVKTFGPASVVTLHPPNSWHVDSIGEHRDISGDYSLTKLKSGLTKLNILFRIRRKTSAAPRKSKFLEHLDEIWTMYGAALEKDFKRQTR